MRRSILLILLLLGASSIYGQGEVLFSNRVSASEIGLPFFVDDGGAVLHGPGPAFTAQLFLVQGDSLTPLFPQTTFQRSGFGPASTSDRYLASRTVQVPDAHAGSRALLSMRVWETTFASFDEAQLANRPTVELGPFGATPTVAATAPGNLVGLRELGLTSVVIPRVPEPSTMAFVVAGACLMAVYHKRETLRA